MLPPSHVAYTWLALSLAHDELGVAPDLDFRLAGLAAMSSDLVDKPLAWLYFYERHRSAVLFAHTLIAYLAVIALALGRGRRGRIYAACIVGHALLDRLWYYPATFYWPLRGWKFHVWGKRGSEQEKIGWAYWVAFTRRRELWTWELGGLLALAYFIWRHRLYHWPQLRRFILTGRVGAESLSAQ